MSTCSAIEGIIALPTQPVAPDITTLIAMAEFLLIAPCSAAAIRTALMCFKPFTENVFFQELRAAAPGTPAWSSATGAPSRSAICCATARPAAARERGFPLRLLPCGTRRGRVSPRRRARRTGGIRWPIPADADVGDRRQPRLAKPALRNRRAGAGGAPALVYDLRLAVARRPRQGVGPRFAAGSDWGPAKTLQSSDCPVGSGARVHYTPALPLHKPFEMDASNTEVAADVWYLGRVRWRPLERDDAPR